MPFRILLVLIVFGVFNIYAVTRFAQGLGMAGSSVTMFALGFFLLQMVAPFGDRLWFPKLKKKYNAGRLVLALDWVSYFAFGLMSLMLFYAMALDLFGIVLKLALPADDAVIDFWIYRGLVGAVIGTSIIGLYQALAGPVVKRVEIKLKNLPASFDGFTIAQISDLHVGPTIKGAYTRKVVEKTNALKADLVALTGDFVDGTVDDLFPDVEPLQDLKAQHGVFFVTGNHELYWNGAAWSEAFRRLGARVLENEHEIIRRGEGAIALSGVTDISSGSMGFIPSDPRKAASGVPEGMTKILLAHQPASYHRALEAGFDLQLSGHAHGGQYFPYSLIVRFFQRYYNGLSRHETMWVYVNTGTGYWGPPLRAGVPPEITLITLRRE